MVINFKKSSCLRIGSRHDEKCADIVSSSGRVIPWVKETRYLGILTLSVQVFLDAHSVSINQSINIRLIKVVRRNLKQLKYWQCIHSIK